MAFTLGVGSSTGVIGSSASVATTLASTTSGRCIIIGVAWESASATISSLACTGETVVLVGSPSAASGKSVQIAYVASLATGGSKTFTATFSSSVAGSGIFAIEFEGGYAASLLDTSVNDSGTSANPSTTLTTGHNNCLVVGVQMNTAGAPTPGSGYTAISGTSSWNKAFKALYNLDAGTAGGETVDWVNASSTDWVIQAASFRVLPASPTISPGVGAISVSGLAPSVGSDKTSVPLTGALALSGQQAQAGSSLSPVITPGVGALALSGTTASVATTATNDGSVTLLTHTLSAAVSSDVIALAATLPAHSVSASVSSESIATASITLLSHSIDAGGNHTLNATLPTHALSATIVGGAVANAQVNLLVHSISSGATPVNVITADIRLLTHAISASGIPENVATLTRTLAAHRISADLLAGNTSSATIELLAHTLNVLAFPESVATANIRLAAHYLDAYATSSIAETFRAWVMNTRNGALSEYTNFQFNSVAKFGAVYLAAGPGGVYVLGGDTDAGAEIDARARTGQLNYGSSFLKRIPRLYVAHSSDGDLVFRTITQEGGTRSYLLQVNGITGEQQRRVPVGTGPKSVRWQFELANRAGSDFELSAILVYPKTLRRRIQ